MKAINSILLFVALAFIVVGCNNNIAKSRVVDPTTVAVFFTSDDANSVAGAAVTQIKYVNSTLFDIDNMTAANQLTAIQTITDSVHRVVLMVDTATSWAT